MVQKLEMMGKKKAVADAERTLDDLEFMIDKFISFMKEEYEECNV